MKKLVVSLLLVFLVSSYANAADFTFDGNITYHNDVVRIDFTLNDDATDVKVWTDSFMDATNFDPITALWNAATGELLMQNDDNDGIAPGQTYYDSGFALPTLAAGDYFFTVATYPNFALGSNIADGFTYDGVTPILLSDWDQPASHFNMGTYWRVNLEGVDSAAGPSPVPLPGAVWLLGSGLLGVFGMSKRKKLAA